MAASYRVDIHKTYLSEEWSNTYLIEAATMTEAASLADILVTFERHMHESVVHFDYYRCSTLAVGDRLFRHKAINSLGLRVTSGADFLPLFNTMRVDFTTADSDPCRKYYRMPIPESITLNGEFTAATLTVLNADINTYFFGTVMGDNLYSPKGHVVVSGSVYPAIQMRQLHRRHKKKVL